MYLSLQTECAFLVLIYQKSSITTLESFRAKLRNYVTVTSPTLGNADAFPYSSVCTCWSLARHTAGHRADGSHLFSLGQSSWSVPLCLWRHKRARVTAHHTSTLFLVLILIHPSIWTLHPSSLSFATGHTVRSICKEMFSSPLFLSLHLLSSLLPVSSAQRGWVGVTGCWATMWMIHCHPISPPPLPLLSFSQGKYCVKAFGLMATKKGHVANSDRKVDELTALFWELLSKTRYCLGC